jgi:hypothetical protein
MRLTGASRSTNKTEATGGTARVEPEVKSCCREQCPEFA